MGGWGGDGLFARHGRGGGEERSRHVECPTMFVQGNRLFTLMTFTLDTIVEMYNLCLSHNSCNSYRDDSQ